MSIIDTPPGVYATVAEYLPSSDRYTVLSIIQSDMNDGAVDQVDSMEVTFMVNGRVGTFSIETPLVYENVPDPQAQAFLIDEYVKQETDVVQALYAL